MARLWFNSKRAKRGTMDANDLCPWCNKFKETELLGDYERGNGFWLQICKLEMQLIS